MYSPNIDTSILVLHNVYGYPCDYSSEKSQVIPALIYKALMADKDKGETISIWGDGSQGRAFVHVSDVVNALKLSLYQGHNAGPIQIGPSTCTSIKEVADIIVENFNLDLAFDTSKPVGDLGRCANYNKAKDLLGWEPTKEIKSGINDLIKDIKTDYEKN